MALFDSWFEKSARGIAQRSSRRSAMAKLGKVLVGSALVPLLPIDRTAYASGAASAASGASGASGASAIPASANDPASCDYWKYCAIDG